MSIKIHITVLTSSSKSPLGLPCRQMNSVFGSLLSHRSSLPSGGFLEGPQKETELEGWLDLNGALCPPADMLPGREIKRVSGGLELSASCLNSGLLSLWLPGTHSPRTNKVNVWDPYIVRVHLLPKEGALRNTKLESQDQSHTPVAEMG